MATCRDCIKADVCKYKNEDVSKGTKVKDLITDCQSFKDKSRYIELPCNVGDTVYEIDYILKITEKCKVYGFQVFADGKMQLLVDNGECKFVTSNWYNTQEEAENKLEE